MTRHSLSTRCVFPAPRSHEFRALLRTGMRLLLVLLALSGVLPTGAQNPVATYRFNNTLQAEEAGMPALVSANPLGLNRFENAVVAGQNRPVFRWDGNANPPAQQAGLTLDATNLVDYHRYSVELIFEFLEPAQAGWRRIMGKQFGWRRRR